jgi:structural maintenance of chromosome 3 (chondroitin sulfate proteoglycan 6)
MIHSQAQDTQFICTTFRPELVSVMDRCFCVVYENRLSHVSIISQGEALDVIHEAEMEDARE